MNLPHYCAKLPPFEGNFQIPEETVKSGTVTKNNFAIFIVVLQNSDLN